MMQLHRIGTLEEKINFNKTDTSKECKICHYNYFSGESHSKICNWCHCGIKSFRNFAILTANGIGYRFIMFDMTEEDVIELMKDPMIDD